MMNTLYIISEGRTESDFVKHVMADHLYQFVIGEIVPQYTQNYANVWVIV